MGYATKQILEPSKLPKTNSHAGFILVLVLHVDTPLSMIVVHS